MNYEQIKEQSQKHPGMKFTQKSFRSAFNLPMTGDLKLINQLIKDGVITKNSSGFVVNPSK